ncbi:methyltransferase domain protein [SAR86 cluster bacterium SAR86E]|uniref:Methyltransferase domain protein n=1 Tax=SAR86 cluster bacterium SAR86E TaxID=1208365 RepID=K6FBL3_9GAMM|nr:methyltransferase domain protein [SAR86 cluster bacterium SAR86E]
MIVAKFKSLFWHFYERFFLGIVGPKGGSIRPIILELKEKFSKRAITVLEVGARFGESSKIVLSNFRVEKYIIVDPYEMYDDYIGDGFDRILLDTGGDKVYNQTRKELLKMNENVVFYRSFSDDLEVLASIPEESLDLIFIDGNHTYDYVLSDLRNYWPKLKPGGVLCGDDFHMRHSSNDKLKNLDGDFNSKMVYEAVCDFCLENHLSYKEYGSHRGYAKTFGIFK